jgi:hypothetical protein
LHIRRAGYSRGITQSRGAGSCTRRRPRYCRIRHCSRTGSASRRASTFPSRTGNRGTIRSLRSLRHHSRLSCHPNPRIQRTRVSARRRGRSWGRILRYPPGYLPHVLSRPLDPHNHAGSGLPLRPLKAHTGFESPCTRPVLMTGGGTGGGTEQTGVSPSRRG